MDNVLLLDRVQNLLLGMEERVDGRLQAMEERIDGKFQAMEERIDGKFQAMEGRIDGKFQVIDARLDTLDRKVDSVRAEVKLHNELLAPFINWSHRIEDEVIRLSSALQDLQARLTKLENPPTH
jgi:chromosome segregation ATPase